MHKGTETCVITSSEKTGNSSHIQDDSFTLNISIRPEETYASFTAV